MAPVLWSILAASQPAAQGESWNAIYLHCLPAGINTAFDRGIPGIEKKPALRQGSAGSGSTSGTP